MRRYGGICWKILPRYAIDAPSKLSTDYVDNSLDNLFNMPLEARSPSLVSNWLNFDHDKLIQ